MSSLQKISQKSRLLLHGNARVSFTIEKSEQSQGGILGRGKGEEVDRAG